MVSKQTARRLDEAVVGLVAVVHTAAVAAVNLESAVSS